jgi:hypothetical protein
MLVKLSSRDIGLLTDVGHANGTPDQAVGADSSGKMGER